MRRAYRPKTPKGAANSGYVHFLFGLIFNYEAKPPSKGIGAPLVWDRYGGRTFRYKHHSRKHKLRFSLSNRSSAWIRERPWERVHRFGENILCAYDSASVRSKKF